MEGEQDFDEDLLDETLHSPDIIEDDMDLNNTLVEINEVLLTIDSITGMNVKVLKEELKKRRCIINGNKNTLRERLVAAVRSGVPVGLPLPPVR